MKIAFNNIINFIEKIYSVSQKSQLSNDLFFFDGEKNLRISPAPKKFFMFQLILFQLN